MICTKDGSNQKCTLKDAMSTVLAESLAIGHDIEKKYHSTSAVGWECPCGAVFEWTKDGGLKCCNGHDTTSKGTLRVPPQSMSTVQVCVHELRRLI